MRIFGLCFTIWAKHSETGRTEDRKPAKVLVYRGIRSNLREYIYINVSHSTQKIEPSRIDKGMCTRSGDSDKIEGKLNWAACIPDDENGAM